MINSFEEAIYEVNSKELNSIKLEKIKKPIASGTGSGYKEDL